MSIDPRLTERRQTVAEDYAKRSMVKLLRFLAVILVVGGAVWLLYSPWLSVTRVDTSGVVESDAHQTLVTSDVVAGTPMFQIASRAVEDRLETDPWIAEASVVKHWPNLVRVDVVERVPAAWTQTSGGWTRRAVDGTAIPSSGPPDPTMAHIELGDLSDTEAAAAVEMVGALEFVAALEPDLHFEAVISRHEGELWATVSGFQIRLGRPVKMAEKARSLSALLDQNLLPGSVLVLIAPTNPAVMSPEDTTRGPSVAEGGRLTDTAESDD